jgi:hypothetical protein
MTSDPVQPNGEWLSEDDAHRVLARAVELDSRAMTDVSLAQLREVAIEAGIALPIFALYEVCVRIARARDDKRGRPQGPGSANDVRARPAAAQANTPDRISRVLLLRPA